MPESATERLHGAFRTASALASPTRRYSPSGLHAPLLGSASASPSTFEKHVFVVVQQYSSLDTPRTTELLESVSRSLDSDPFEPGQSHPAQAIVSSAIETAPRFVSALPNWFRAADHDRRAEILLLLAHLRLPKAAALVEELAADELDSRSFALRDAAVHALEIVGGARAVELLKRRIDEEPDPLLRDYVERVVRDLTR